MRSSSTTRAVQSDPDNVNARTGLQRARLRASQDHFTNARRHVANRRLEEAVTEYKLAAELNPDNRAIADELEQSQNQLRAQVVINRDGKTELEALVERMRDQRLPGLDVVAEPLPDELIFRDASNQVIIRALAQMSKVNVVFDPAFRPTPISIEIRNQTFADALQSITASTQNFYRVTAPRTITIIPDTPAKRREYQEDIVRTFYLSSADIKETMDLLRIVIDARRIGGMQGTNAITITDTAERVEAAGRLITMIDKARPEVLIDVELLEVSRTRLNEYGLQFASPESTGISGVADVNKPGLTFDDLRNLTGSQVLMTNVPALYYRLIKEDGTGRVLANPQLRTQVGMPAQAQFGERVPVAGDDVLSDCHRWGESAADYVVRVREHRRQHRHHAADAHEQRRDAGPGDFGDEHFRHRFRRAADLREPADQDDHSPERRRNEYVGRVDSRRRTEGARRDPRIERYSRCRSHFWPHAQ